MTVQYHTPLQDMQFLHDHVSGLSRLQTFPDIEEQTPEVVQAVLDGAARFAREVIAPINRASEETPPVLQDGQVKTAPGYAQAWQAFVANGWNGLDAPTAFGGQGLAGSLAMSVNELWHSASMSFALCPMLTAGAIHALQTHADGALCQTYLPSLVSGEWTGTMNLTESQAGSDLAAIAARAVPEGDHYRIFGTKIFITWGDHDVADNIIHLVLARLPDAPAGVKGISLFLVPKILPDGTRNDVWCTALEDKVGIHGSPTAVMQFGDEDGAIGYLVGKPNEGLACMFTMMNHARLQVGMQGLGVAQSALEIATGYASTRAQGRTRLSFGGQGMIEDHPDVRRMLLMMQSGVLAMRGLVTETATELDIADLATGHDAQTAQARADLLVPVAKGWCTELAVEITSLALQVHGGMGYIEETGIGQLWRDARITTIYEGTTAIQANDFIGRKVLHDNGKALESLIDEIQHSCDQLERSDISGHRQFGSQLREAARTLSECLGWTLSTASNNSAAVYFASVPMLMLTGYVVGGWMIARRLLAADNLQKAHARATQSAAAAYGALWLMPSLGLAQTIRQAPQLLSQCEAHLNPGA